METIKKTIKRAMTTGTTTICDVDDCFIIVPDLNAVYNFKILLTKNDEDLGFFDVDEDSVSGITPTQPTYVVTGITTNRLSELRKYLVTENFLQMYHGNGSFTNNGVDYLVSDPESIIVYYINGIKYYYNVVDDITTFEFLGVGYNSPNFINYPYYKNFNKEDIISNPKIDSDVFIVRQELSVFEKNYALEFVTNLNEIETYAGGGFFTIKNNM